MKQENDRTPEATFAALLRLERKGLLRTMLVVVLPAVTAVGLLISAAHQYYSISMLQQQLIRLATESGTTQYVGVFPDNVRTITELLRDARSEVILGSSGAAYGSFSDPDAFNEYLKVLESLAMQDVRIRMLVPSDALTYESIFRQFGGSFGELRRAPSFKRYFDIHFGLDRPATMAEFADILVKEERFTRASLSSRGVVIEETADPLPLSYWIVDTRTAVFAFTRRDLSFRTGDSNLIRALMETSDEIHGRRVLRGH